MTRFQPAEQVVVPGLGLGTISRIESIPLEGSELRAYCVEIAGEEGRMWVPLNRAGEAGLRRPMSAEVAEEAIEIAAKQEAPHKRAHWNRRQRRYQEWLSSDNPHDVARLVGELASVRQVKKSPLSFGERRLFEKAKDHFVRELSASLGVDQARIEKRLDKRLAS